MKFKRMLSAVVAAAIGISMFVGINISANAAGETAEDKKYAEWDLREAKTNPPVGTEAPERISGDEDPKGSIITMGYKGKGVSTEDAKKPMLYYKRPSSNLSAYSLYRGTAADFTTYSGTTVTLDNANGDSNRYGYKGSKGYGYTYIVDPRLSDNDATSYNLKIVFYSNSTYKDTAPTADLRCSLKVVQLDSLAHGKVAKGTAETITDEKLADTDENKTTTEVISANSSDLKECIVKDLTKPSSFGFDLGQPALVYVGIEYKKSETPEIKLDEKAEVLQGETIKLEPTLINAEGAEVEWSTENLGHVQVGSDGSVTGLSEGKETVTATIKVGGFDYLAECVVTVRGLATVTYEADGKGIVPEAVTVAKDSQINLPKNWTMYVEGKTLTGWSDGTTTYPLGTAYTVKDNITLTAEFTDNKANLGDAAGNVNFTFMTKDGVPSVTKQGEKDKDFFLTAPATIGNETIDLKLDIDVSKGSIAKFDNSAWDDCAQLNPDTKLSVPVVQGSVISITGYNENSNCTVGETQYKGATMEIKITDDIDICEIVVGDGGPYWKSISVTYPQLTLPEVIVKEEESFTSGTGNPARLYTGTFRANRLKVTNLVWTITTTNSSLQGGKVNCNEYENFPEISGGADYIFGLIVTAPNLADIGDVTAELQ